MNGQLLISYFLKRFHIINFHINVCYTCTTFSYRGLWCDLEIYLCCMLPLGVESALHIEYTHTFAPEKNIFMLLLEKTNIDMTMK